MLSFKWLFKPKSDELVKVKVAQMYLVRWWARYGEFSGDVKEQMEGFTSEQDARAFADSLRAAYKLLRHTSCITVTVEKN